MNKAQRKYVADFEANMAGKQYNIFDCITFATEYNKIDPTPDPENFQVNLYTSGGNKQLVHSGNKKDCDAYLDSLLNTEELYKLKKVELVTGVSLKIMFNNQWDDHMEWKVEKV